MAMGADATMNTKLSPPLIEDALVERIIALLPWAEWVYDDEIGEMEIVLPGCAGREAQWIDLDDYWNLHLRLDPMSGEPLSIVIYPFRSWLAAQERQPLPSPDAPIDYAVARHHLAQSLRRLGGQWKASNREMATAARGTARLDQADS